MGEVKKKKDWDPATLDGEYSPSSLVDSLDFYLEAYASRSRETRAALAGNSSIALKYGPHPRHRLDFFSCGIEGAPLVVFIHGGFWCELDESSFSFPANEIINIGAHFASITYRLAPETRLGNIVADTERALGWLADNAAGMALDKERIILVGHSAGAHLAAMMMASGVVPPIAAAMLISGVYDLAPVQKSYVNDTVRISNEEVARCSPLKLRPVQSCPVALVVGEIETDEFKRQSSELFGKWAHQLPGSDLQEQKGRNHFDILFDLARPKSDLFIRLKNLLKGTPDD